VLISAQNVSETANKTIKKASISWLQINDKPRFLPGFVFLSGIKSLVACFWGAVLQVEF